MKPFRTTDVLVLGVIIFICLGVAISLTYKLVALNQRMRCQGNLKQLGFALRAYVDTHGLFPRATIPSATLSPADRFSWLMAIMPYEQSNSLYSDVDRTESWRSERNYPVIVGPFDPYICPGYGDYRNPTGPGPTNYIGMAGLGTDSPMLAKNDPKVGIFGEDRDLSLKDIKRPLSQTIMVSETNVDIGPWAAGGSCTVRGLDQGRPPYLGRACQFGGLHPGGGNALFVDGSIRFLEVLMDSQVFEAMVMIGGVEGQGQAQ
jgi:prepilin-type processing-associated H-X9-DG protein